jgi:hypothetical protein
MQGWSMASLLSESRRSCEPSSEIEEYVSQFQTSQLFSIIKSLPLFISSKGLLAKRTSTPSPIEAVLHGTASGDALNEIKGDLRRDAHVPSTTSNVLLVQQAVKIANDKEENSEDILRKMKRKPRQDASMSLTLRGLALEHWRAG